MQANKLQIGIIVGAIVLVFLAILVLIGALPGLRDRSGSGGTLVMWGFEKSDLTQSVFLDFTQKQRGAEIKYIEKRYDSWESDLLNTLASGGASVPDIIVFPSDYLKKHKDKIAIAPSILITEREIRQQYIEAAENFLGSKNEVLGIPFYADALLLYWNKDIFTQNLITLPPKTWDEFRDISQKITKKDSSGNIILSGAALGRGLNIKNIPLILSSMFLQSGDRIVNQGGEIVLGNALRIGEVDVRPAESVLRFISDFSNPRKTVQSWSAALPEAKEAFVSEKLAMYIGRVSEYREIKNRNPHLNFAVSLLPQLKDSPREVTGGALYALAVTKASSKQRAAWDFIKFLTTKANADDYANRTGNVSLRRDLLPQYQKESVRSVFAESALALKLWPVPDPKVADQIFRDFMEDVALERATIREAVDKAKARLQNI